MLRELRDSVHNKAAAHSAPWTTAFNGVVRCIGSQYRAVRVAPHKLHDSQRPEEELRVFHDLFRGWVPKKRYEVCAVRLLDTHKRCEGRNNYHNDL
jgi:hypothetical protein